MVLTLSVVFCDELVPKGCAFFTCCVCCFSVLVPPPAPSLGLLRPVSFWLPSGLDAVPVPHPAAVRYLNVRHSDLLEFSFLLSETFSSSLFPVHKNLTLTRFLGAQIMRFCPTHQAPCASAPDLTASVHLGLLYRHPSPHPTAGLQFWVVCLPLKSCGRKEAHFPLPNIIHLSPPPFLSTPCYFWTFRGHTADRFSIRSKFLKSVLPFKKYMWFDHCIGSQKHFWVFS